MACRFRFETSYSRRDETTNKQTDEQTKAPTRISGHSRLSRSRFGPASSKWQFLKHLSHSHRSAKALDWLAYGLATVDLSNTNGGPIQDRELEIDEQSKTIFYKILVK